MKRAEETARNTGRTDESAGEAAAEAAPAGTSPQANIANVSLVLPCPLIVLGTTTAPEAGRPLSDLLRRIGYL